MVENKTDVLYAGTLQWYEQKLHELQDWLLDEAIYAATPAEKKLYKEILHRIIDMFCGTGANCAKIAEEMDEYGFPIIGE